MEVNAQTIINLLFTGTCVLVGWLLNSFKDAIKELKKEDKVLAQVISENNATVTERLHRVEVLVSGQYMTRAEAEERMDKSCKGIFEYLRRIEEKIDKKADKQ